MNPQLAIGDSKLLGELTAFRRKFEEDHGVRIVFETEAIAEIESLAKARNQSGLTVCDELFHDFQFGLKLIQQNTGRNTFHLGADAVRSPDEFLSQLVVSSYQKEGETKEPGSVETPGVEENQPG